LDKIQLLKQEFLRKIKIQTIKRGKRGKREEKKRAFGGRGNYSIIKKMIIGKITALWLKR